MPVNHQAIYHRFFGQQTFNLPLTSMDLTVHNGKRLTHALLYMFHQSTLPNYQGNAKTSMGFKMDQTLFFPYPMTKRIKAVWLQKTNTKLKSPQYFVEYTVHACVCVCVCVHACSKQTMEYTFLAQYSHYYDYRLGLSRADNRTR